MGAALREPDVELTEDIVKFGMGFHGKRITDTLPKGRPAERGMFQMAVRALPPNHRPLLLALRAVRMERNRWRAGLGHFPARLPKK